MGRSSGSSSKKNGGGVNGGGGGGSGGNTETFPNQSQSARSNVRDLLEKLQSLRPDRDDFLQLESVQAVLSALEEENCPRVRVSPTPVQDDCSQEDLSCSSSSVSQLENSSKSVARGIKQTCGGGGVVPVPPPAAGKLTTMGSTRSGIKSPKKFNVPGSDSGSGSGVSSGGSSSNEPLIPVGNNVKRGFATLIRNCEHFYKRVAKKYFFILRPRKPSKSNAFGVFFSILAFIFYFELHTINGFSRLWLKWENVDLGSVECTIESPNLAMELFRPPVSCAICHNVKSADRVQLISPAEFERVYAYTGRPVIVTDAMTNWTAPSAFSFEFFKGMYSEGSRSLVHLDEDCLFFPYQTEFRSLAEVFNMTKERAQRRWYIGWSNCDAETSHILRQHYERPYFLPETAESTHADWIFMGTSGKGAHMHIDHVINPSWQGQIKGIKRWHLQPPPECFYECQSFHVDVHPGDIIVLDTNKWYHMTEILPGENSITIGSEYD